MTAEKVLKQERQLAEAIASTFTDDEYLATIESLIDNVHPEVHSLVLARVIFGKIGIQSAYDAMLEEALESERIEKMMAHQTPQAAETVRKLRAEFSALPTDGLKALRMLIDSAIREKEAS